MKPLSWLLLAIAVCFSLPASAGTFYVSPSGSGTTCSQASPCSIKRAFSTAVAGDIWNFNAGTYTPTSSMLAANSGTSCTAGGMITFQATPGSERLAVINGQTIGSTGKSYIKFAGFKIRNEGNPFIIQGPGTCIRVDNNEIVNASDSAIYFKGYFNSTAYNNAGRAINLTDVIAENNYIHGGGSGPNEMISIAYGVDNYEIRNNLIGDFDQIGIDSKYGVSNGKVHGNTFFGDADSQIYLDAISGSYVQDIEIYNNTVAANGAGISMVREDWNKTGGDLRRIRIYNNIVNGGRRQGIRIGRHSQDTTNLGSCTDIDIYNNTIFNTGWESGHTAYGIDIDLPLCTDIRIRNNILWQHDGPEYRNNAADAVQSNNLLDTVNPLFVSQGTGDFHLQSGSPAIDAGTPTGAPSGVALDFDGNSRPAGTTWDIGAFEFGGTGSGGETGRPCELLTSADAVPSGVAAAYNVFSGTEETLITVNCGATANAEVDIGNSASTTWIYKFAYEWDGSSWDQVALSGGQASGDWFVGSAQATLTRSSGELSATNYIAAYLCLWVSNAWKCGCRDATCASNFWNLQTFTQQ